MLGNRSGMLYVGVVANVEHSHVKLDKEPSIYDVRSEGGVEVREMADFADEQY